RSFYVRLTPCGEGLFQEVFPKVIAHGKQLFASLTEADFDQIDAALGKLKQLIASADQGPDQAPCPPYYKEEY
ncbi:MAG TPA: MarR family transcriptional regulator, partial [Telluria sp.]|nr:MarR family transcriptional regulator [Telluria sp.]